MVDLAVIGVGGLGSSVCYQAAKKGLNVIGLEQFELNHHHGSSHGQTRAIRKAYFEEPDYIPLLKRVYGLWRELEEQAEQSLMALPSIVMHLPSESDVLENMIANAKTHDIAIEEVEKSEAKKRWPLFNIEDSHQILYEPDAGYLWVERCVEVQIKGALRHGATLKSHTCVERYQWVNDHYELMTSSGVIKAKHLIVASGAWLPQVVRQTADFVQPYWVDTGWFPLIEGTDQSELEGLPVWFSEHGTKQTYGFPMLDERGMKVAFHQAHREARQLFGNQRQSCLEALQHLGEAAQRFIPSLSPVPSDTSVCLYAMTPDENFVVGRIQEGLNKGWYAGGFSGHGFKFCPVIAEHLIERVMNEPLTCNLDFLRPRH
jgi:monomeric sarcosine oxidase